MRHLTVLNIILLTATLILGIIVYTQYNSLDNFSPEPYTTKEPIAPKKDIGSTVQPQKVPVSTQSTSRVQDYGLITEKNLFHPDRAPQAAKVANETRPAEKPDIILYGTIIDRGKRLALIEDKKNPYTTPGRGKRQRLVKINDEISGYRVIKITQNSIEIGNEEDTFTFTVEDSSKDKHKGIVPQQPNTKQAVRKKPKIRKRPIKRLIHKR